MSLCAYVIKYSNRRKACVLVIYLTLFTDSIIGTANLLPKVKLF